MQKMKVALLGAGAIGGYFIPGLTRYLEDDFFLLADKKRAERLKKEGVLINDEMYYPNVLSYEEAPIPDAILISTKYGALNELKERLPALIGEKTIAVSLLNGVDSEEILAETLGKDHVVHAFMRVSSVRDESGIHFRPDFGAVHIGQIGKKKPDGQVAMLIEVFEHAGIHYIYEEDIVKEQWFKYACNIAENQTQGILGVPFGAFREHEHANFIRLTLMKECMAVANAMGVKLEEERIEKQNEVLKKIPPKNKTSMLQDLENGRRTEVDMFAGKLIEMAKKVSIEVPFNEFVYHAIRTMEDRNEGNFLFTNE